MLRCRGCMSLSAALQASVNFFVLQTLQAVLQPALGGTVGRVCDWQRFDKSGIVLKYSLQPGTCDSSRAALYNRHVRRVLRTSSQIFRQTSDFAKPSTFLSVVVRAKFFVAESRDWRTRLLIRPESLLPRYLTVWRAADRQWHGST